MTTASIVQPGWEELAPGVSALLRPDAGNDIVALLVFAPIGNAAESPADAGILSFTGRMLMRGTKRLSNAELSELVDSLGISLSCDISSDYSNLHLVTTRDTLAESVALMSEVFIKPAFEPEELEKERQSTLAAIRRSEDDLFSLTLERFYRELYPSHGYGLPIVGLKESVGEFTREQTLNAHEELCRGPFKVVAVGNFEPEEMRALIVQHFQSSAEQSDIAAAAPPLPTPAPPHGVQFTRNSEQSYLVMGYPAIPPTGQHYFAARVLNALLGEGMSSRLFTALREEKGLAYATGSSYAAQHMAGQLFGYIGTKPESLQTAKEGMLAEFERIKNEPVPEEELLRAKNYLVGKFLIDHQKNYRRGFYLGHFDQMGLGWQMDDLYASLIAGVTAEQVQQVANIIFAGKPTVVELDPGANKH